MKRCGQAVVLAVLASLIGCNHVDPPRSSNSSTAPSPSLAPTNEREIAYEIDREEQGQPKPVSEQYDFHSDDRFRIRFRPDFAAYIYVVNRGEHEGSYHVLFPSQNEQPQNPLGKGVFAAVPSDTDWLRFDKTPGNEFFFLIASTVSLPDFEQSPLIPRDTFDVELAQVERRYQPSSSHRFQDHNLTKFFAARKGDLALVVRLNLQHQ
jgi:hypothetical protein